MSELRECPFCGNEFPTITETQSKVVLIRCPQCNTTFSRDYYESGRGELGKQRTIEAWNRRAERTGRWVPIVNTWTQDEHEYGSTVYKCDQCGRTSNTKQPYCHCGAKMAGEGERNE